MKSSNGSAITMVGRHATTILNHSTHFSLSQKRSTKFRICLLYTSIPAAKAKVLKDGGYVGKTVVLGIRPEDIHDSQMFIEASPSVPMTSTVKVYELLGAEVFLYFDVNGTQVTARVDQMCIRDRFSSTKISERNLPFSFSSRQYTSGPFIRAVFPASALTWSLAPIHLGTTWKSILIRDRKSTRLNSSHITRSRMPSSA